MIASGTAQVLRARSFPQDNNSSPPIYIVLQKCNGTFFASYDKTQGECEALNLCPVPISLKVNTRKMMLFHLAPQIEARQGVRLSATPRLC